ncbi:AAA family ATPase [Streptomyces sp. ET3-23]|uniref:AAA family ATPase n=1 Tax=Streptomyces sp. ET3-23 TaxID=2885643 RepID=UPI001D115123|nr:AAA family ATPase [Streptomyces sp. ET3-23]MCC2275481.1 AAA family ATPase [Streptomyces sp. ET3-23]
MQHLVRVEAEQFRAFEEVALDLGRRGLILVTGPNNVGKSALLSILDALAGITPEGSQHYGRPSSITATWELTSGGRRRMLADVPDADNLFQGELATHLKVKFGDLLGKLQPVAVSVSAAEDWLELGHLDMTVSGQWKISRRSLTDALKDDQTWTNEVSGGGPPGDTLSYFGPIVQDTVEHWRARYFHFQPLRQTSGRTAQLRGITPTLATDGSNLATVLLHLQTNQPETWAQIRRLVSEIIPDVGELMTPVNGDQCEIVFWSNERRDLTPRNLKDLGTGVEQLLMLLVAGLTQQARTVVLEDPEIGLHPSAQRALLGLLQDWSRGRMILAATHSAAMLDWTSPSTTVVAVRRRRGVSTADVVTTERAEVLRELGIRMSDILSAERILVLEGPTDRDILDIWFADVLRNPRVVVLNGGGGSDARHADLLADWLADADQLGQRRVLYVRDRDEMSEAAAARLRASGNVFVLPVREVENLLLDAEAVTKLINQERGKQNKEQMAVSEVAKAMRTGADELRQTVVLKRVMAELNPIRLADNKLRAKLAKAQADEKALAAAVTERIPLRGEVEALIGTAWAAHTRTVDDTWEQNWKALAPGADVLGTVMTRLLDRGYSKGTDGPALARFIQDPPAALRDEFDKFMADSAD